MEQRILVVDDEQDICDILVFNLRVAGYVADSAGSAPAALAMRPAEYDLLLLDVMMPGMSGFDLARQLGGQVPIVFLTAKDSEADVLQGFDLGADDYIAKPFSVREVLARVRAVLARTFSSLPVLRYQGLVLDPALVLAKVDEQHVNLTKTEFRLLEFLMQNSGQVFTRQQLVERVWPSNVIVTDRAVDVNITRLRKKLMHYGSHLVARSGYGYCFDAQ